VVGDTGRGRERDKVRAARLTGHGWRRRRWVPFGQRERLHWLGGVLRCGGVWSEPALGLGAGGHAAECHMWWSAAYDAQPKRSGSRGGADWARASARRVGRDGLSGRCCPAGTCRAGDATNRAAQRGRRSGTRAESCRSASKGARRRQPVGAANGRCGRRLAGALLDWDSRRRRERTSRGAAPDWGRMTSATDGRGPVVRERERAPRGRGCYGLGQVSGLIW
jgi:hypothetical protein